jgi:hypothetical protein
MTGDATGYQPCRQNQTWGRDMEALCRIAAGSAVGQLDRVVGQFGGPIDDQVVFVLYDDLQRRMLDQVSRALAGDVDRRLVLWAVATLNSND